jgi:O-methyltransferase
MIVTLINKFFNTPKKLRWGKIKLYISHKFVQKFLLRKFNSESGRYYLSYRPDFNFDVQSKTYKMSKDIYDAWIHEREPNLGDYTRLYFIYLNLKHCIEKNIDGSIAEIGVYKGNSAKLMHNLAPERRIYLFDTFEGFNQKDLQAETISIHKDAFKDTSLKYVKDFVGTDDKVIYCKGYFPETAKYVIQNEKFALVHIDCDIYEPIKASLEYFYPMMVKGGLIIVHDYATGFWTGATRAVDEFLPSIQETPVLIPDKSGSLVIPINK